MKIDLFMKGEAPHPLDSRRRIGKLRGTKSRPVIWPQLRWEGRSFGGRLDMRATVIAMAGLLVALGATLVGAGFGSWQLGASFGGLAITIAGFIVLTGRYQATGLIGGIEASVLESVLDSASEGRIVVDHDGELVAANRRYRTFLGGRLPSPVKILSGSEIGLSADEFLKILKEKGTASCEVLWTHKGQETRFLLSAKTYGSFALWRLRRTAVDLSLEKAVIWAGTIMESNLASLKAGIIVTDAYDVIRYANPLIRKFLGRRPEILFARKLAEVLDERGYSSEGSKRGERVDLIRFPVPVVGGPGLAGEIVILRPMEGRLRSADDKGFPGLSLIFEDAPLAMAMVDEIGVIREFNRAFASIYKQETGDTPQPNSSFFDLARGSERTLIAQALKMAIDDRGQEVPLALRLGKDGERVVKAIIGAISGAESPHAVVYLLDATEQLRLEDQFVQAQKMQAVGQLAGGVAHDFNNLLTAIIGFSDLLLARHGPGDQSFGDLMQIKQNSNRAANLVRQLLAFSRRQTLRPEVLDVTEVLAEIATLVRRLLGEQIELKMEHGRNLDTIKGDLGQLEQVIINLVVNARDAMVDGGVLIIRTRSVTVKKAREMGEFLIMPGKYVEISVKDNGVGIEASALDKIFEPFFTTKEVGKGTGLGLSTVYGIVTQSGGFVDVLSEPGKGTEMRISLPAFTEKASVTQAEPAPPAGSGAPRDLTGKGVILLVEDEEAVRIFAARALVNKGYHVIEASDGEAAMEVLEDADGAKVEMLISDVVMPGMDGPTLADKARELVPGIKVILVSGYAEESFRGELAEKNVTFLPKPFTLKQLAEEVKTTFDA